MSKEKAEIEAILGKKYDIRSQIATGGMGKIYLGVHRSLNKPVAIKIIHQEFRKDETFRKRFHREARLAANLDHPSIVDIYDFGSSNYFDYIIMPFIEGETLKETLKREKRLPLSQSLDLIAAIASALLFAHNNNVVHRDIKPSNILIDKQKRAHLTDFGISKDMEAAELTLPDTVMGSPKYISPEQITGKTVDGRCDLYALGLVFYEMVTGVYPYAGRNTNAIYYAQVNEVPKPPDQVNPDIPEAISDIIMKLIEKDPEDRYQSGSGVLQDIANFKSGHPLGQSVEDEAPIIENNLPDNFRDEDGDLPTVVNIPKKDRNRLLANQPIAVESNNSEMNSRSKQFSSWYLVSFAGVFVLLMIIGYFFWYKPSPQNEKFVALKSSESPESSQERKPVAPAEKDLSMNEQPTTAKPLPITPMPEEAPIKNALPVSPQPESDSSEAPLPRLPASQPATDISFASISKQLKALGTTQEANFIRLWTKKNVYKIGDSIKYHVESSQDCYLNIILFSSAGEIIQVFPNRYHPDEFISTGNSYSIPSPDSDVKLEVTGPPGIEELIALSSDRPLKIFPFEPEDMPFFVFDTTDPSLLKQVHDNLQPAKTAGVKNKTVQYLISK